MNFWPFAPPQAEPRTVTRYVVATKRESAAARTRRTEVQLQLAVYAACVPLEQRKAETAAYWERMRANG